MAELGTTREDEGCSLAQLIVFFDNHKITFYAVDFRFSRLNITNTKDTVA